jgi:hypothetical protein
MFEQIESKMMGRLKAALIQWRSTKSKRDREIVDLFIDILYNDFGLTLLEIDEQIINSLKK